MLKINTTTILTSQRKPPEAFLLTGVICFSKKYI